MNIFLLSARNGAPWRSSSHSGKDRWRPSRVLAGRLTFDASSATTNALVCNATAQILDESDIADVLKRVELAVRGTLGLIS
jgi:hypothetical protein